MSRFSDPMLASGTFLLTLLGTVALTLAATFVADVVVAALVACVPARRGCWRGLRVVFTYGTGLLVEA